MAIDPTGRRYAITTGQHISVTTLIGGDIVFAATLELAGERRDRRFAFTTTGALWWELVNGERWRSTNCNDEMLVTALIVCAATPVKSGPGGATAGGATVRTGSVARVGPAACASAAVGRASA